MHPDYTLQQFNSLPNDSKYLVLENNGVYLQVFRLEGKYKVALFALSAFYVEVWLDQVDDNIGKAEAFDEYEKLDPFLKEINLAAIYSRL